MVRAAIVVMCAVYFIGLGLVAIALYRASPGPDDQAIAGVTVGDSTEREDLVYLSGRRLACMPDERDGLVGSRCTIAIAGETLEIRAFRNPRSYPNQLVGVCEARYAGQERTCSFSMRHFGVPYFAYIADSLGLSDDQRAALRREYFFENLGEEVFLAAMRVVPPLTAFVVASGVLAGCWHWSQRRSLVAGAAIIAGLATLPFAFFGMLLATRGFWD